MPDPTAAYPVANSSKRDPCFVMWDGCEVAPDESHICHRPEGHEARHACDWCGATTSKTDPIFVDPEELELAQEALDEC